jgi:serine/threonine-protein kinase
MRIGMAAPEETETTQRSWGDPISGKYRVERVLGEGGMGIILEATHMQLDERVAIKMLRQDLARDEETVQRFLREAKAAIKIRSEHVVRVHDVAALENGAPYIVMELLEGQDLERLVREHGPVDPADAVDYVLQACEALAEAHALGMVHRDLKPANLFLTHRKDGSPCVKVLDFGITKIQAGPKGNKPDLGITRTQAIFGSPKYMSPEQMRSSREVDARSDIWALGAILYELVAGRAPFDAETMPSLCALVLNEPPPPLPEHVPDALAAVILRCLRKNPDDRYANVGELARALSSFGSSRAEISAGRIRGVLSSSDPSLRGAAPGVRSSRSHPKLASNSEPRFSGVTSAAWGDVSAAPPRGRRWAAFAAIAAGIVAATLLGYMLATSTHDARPTTRAATTATPPPVDPAAFTATADFVKAAPPATAIAPEAVRAEPARSTTPARATAVARAPEPPPAQTFAPVVTPAAAAATATTTATAITTTTAAAAATTTATAAANTNPIAPATATAAATTTAAKSTGSDLFKERK